ncbi:transposase, partial [Aggregatibacter actinomycetemcomitans]|uniref:transposase n=1 Tax=Aggregatibacter actinomycetemcomitans TaxID=714 RepID=UPI00192E4129
YGNRHFWSKGYYVSTVGLNTKTVEEYIRNQEKEDMIQDNLSKKGYVDPFQGVGHRVISRLLVFICPLKGM